MSFWGLEVLFFSVTQDLKLTFFKEVNIGGYLFFCFFFFNSFQLLQEMTYLNVGIYFQEIQYTGMYTILAWGTIMKYHRMSGLNNRYLFLTGLETGKSKITVLAYFVCDKSLLPDSQVELFSCKPHITEGGHGSVLRSLL